MSSDTEAAFEVPRKSSSLVASLELFPTKTNCIDGEEQKRKFIICTCLPSLQEIKQYISVLLCGLSLWGTSWFLLDSLVLPGGYIFNMAAVVIVGYVSGHTLERYTSIHPVVGMTLIGALFRYFSNDNFLEHPVANVIDYHLRRVYPVIILTRGPLGWNWEYIRKNSLRVFSLATLPWVVEWLSSAILSHVLLGFTWYWGLHLGAILASVSPAVVVPTASSLSARGLGVKNQIALLVANAGGLDTAFTEGMFGVINSAIFYPAPLYYRITKAVLAIFVGIGLGVAWGVLIDLVPDHCDPYAPTIRSLLIFALGLLLSYAGGFLGWGGTSGVAIMVCAGAAATRWSRRSWAINDNPVSEIYKLLWRIFEPMLFTLSGYYLEVSSMTVEEFWSMVGVVMVALLLRLITAFLVALINELTVKESIFIAITWIPKAIVEAVLVRVASDSLWSYGASSQDKKAAKMHSNIIVIAILITTTLGSALTTAFGPFLLALDSRVAPAGTFNFDYNSNDLYSPPTALSTPRSEHLIRQNSTQHSYF